MPRLDRLWYEIDAQTKGFDEGIVQSGNKLRAFVQYAATHPVVVLGALGVAATAAAVKLAGMAAEFEHQMAAVRTVTDTTQISMEELSEGIIETFRELPIKSLQELTKGLYDIISSGIPAGDAIAYLGVASRAAIGGMTSVAVAVDGLTSVTNAFALQGLDATRAADIMFEAVNKGKQTFEELSNTIGLVAPVAASYGIALEDVLAAQSQLTLSGLNASEAMIAIRSSIVNIIQPSGLFAKQFPALAREFTAAKLAGVGYVQFLRDFDKASGGSKEALNALFRDVQGKVGVMALLKDHGDAVVEMMGALEQSQGAASRAQKIMDDTAKSTSQRLKNDLSISLTQLGERFLPAYNTMLEKAITVTKFFNGELARLNREMQNTRDLSTITNLGNLGERLKPGTEGMGRMLVAYRNLRITFQRGELGKALADQTGPQLRALHTSIRSFLLATGAGTQQDVELLQALSAQIVKTEAAAAKADNARRATIRQQNQSQLDLATTNTAAARAREEELLGTRRSASAAEQRAQALESLRNATLDVVAAEKELRDAVSSGDQTAIDSAGARATAAKSAHDALAESYEMIINETKAQAAEEQRLAKERQQEREAEVEQQRQMREQLEQMFADATVTLIDDTQLAIARLNRELAENSIVGAEAARALGPLEERLRVLRELEPIQRGRINERSVGSLHSGNDVSRELQRAVAAEQRLVALRKTLTAGSKNLAQVDEEIRSLRERQVALTERNVDVMIDVDKIMESLPEDLRKILDIETEIERKRRESREHLKKTVDTIADVARGAIGVAQGMGAISDGAAAALQNIVSIGESVPGILSGNPQDIIKGLGGLVGVIGGIFGGESPEEKKRRRENTDALVKLTNAIGDMNLSFTGTNFARLRSFAQRGARGEFSNFSAFSFGNVNEERLSAELRNAGVSLQEFERLANDLGFTFEDITKISQRELIAFNNLLREVELTQFADDFEGQLQAINASFELLDLDDPLQKLEALRDVFSSPQFGSPALRRALAGLDLSTAEGRAQADKAVRALFEQLRSGGLTPQDLGGLTPQQFLDALLEAEGLVDEIGAAAEEAAGGDTTDDSASNSFSVDRSITEVTGNRLAGLLTSTNLYASRTADATELMAAMMSGRTVGAIVPPTITGVAPGTGSVIVQIDNLNVGADWTATRAQISAELAALIDQALQERAATARTSAGNVEIV